MLRAGSTVVLEMHCHPLQKSSVQSKLGFCSFLEFADFKISSAI